MSKHLVTVDGGEKKWAFDPATATQINCGNHSTNEHGDESSVLFVVGGVFVRLTAIDWNNGDGTWQTIYRNDAVQITDVEALAWCEAHGVKVPEQLAQVKLGPPAAKKRFLTAAEAAEYLEISCKALYAKVSRKKLVPMTGNRFTREQLDAYMKGNTDGTKVKSQRAARRR